MKFNPPLCIKEVTVNVLKYIEKKLLLLLNGGKLILCMPDWDKVNFD